MMLAIGTRLSLIPRLCVLPVNIPRSISGSMARIYPALRPMSPRPLRPSPVSMPCHPPTFVRRGAACCGSVDSGATSFPRADSSFFPGESTVFCPSFPFSSPTSFPSVRGFWTGLVSGVSLTAGSCIFVFASIHSCSWPGAMTFGTALRWCASTVSMTALRARSAPTNFSPPATPPPRPPIVAKSAAAPRPQPIPFSTLEGLYISSARSSISLWRGVFLASSGSPKMELPAALRRM